MFQLGLDIFRVHCRILITIGKKLPSRPLQLKLQKKIGVLSINTTMFFHSCKNFCTEFYHHGQKCLLGVLRTLVAVTIVECKGLK